MLQKWSCNKHHCTKYITEVLELIAAGVSVSVHIIAVHELCSQDDLLTVGRITDGRVRVVCDHVRDRVKQVLADVVLAVVGQLNWNMVDTVRTQHRQRVRTPGLQQSTSLTLSRK